MTKLQKKKAVQGLLKKWQPRLLLTHWDIVVDISPTEHEGEPLVAGECTTSVTYHSAHIRIYPRAFKSKEYLEKVFKHEMCHILTGALFKAACDLHEGKLRSPEDIEIANEQLTEWISRLV